MEDLLILNYFKNKQNSDEYIEEHTEPSISNTSPHFTEEYAKSVVSRLSHSYRGILCVGQHFGRDFAEELYEHIKEDISDSVNIDDIYVAINTSYHMHYELFIKWFGDNSDIRIIEESINCWFKDSNCTSHNKIWDYHK